MKSGTCYKYAYDKDGKVVSLARKTMEEMLGRPLTQYETVSYKDGNKSNCTAENLYLCFKKGTPFHNIVCRECGTRGNIEIRAEES